MCECMCGESVVYVRVHVRRQTVPGSDLVVTDAFGESTITSILSRGGGPLTRLGRRGEVGRGGEGTLTLHMQHTAYHIVYMKQTYTHITYTHTQHTRITYTSHDKRCTLIRIFFFPSLMADPVRPSTSLVPSPSLLPSADTGHFLASRLVSLWGLLLPPLTSALSVTPMVGSVGTEVPVALLVRVLTGDCDPSDRELVGEGCCVWRKGETMKVNMKRRRRRGGEEMRRGGGGGGRGRGEKRCELYEGA